MCGSGGSLSLPSPPICVMEEEGSWVFVVIVRGLFSGEAEVKTWSGQGWAGLGLLSGREEGRSLTFYQADLKSYTSHTCFPHCSLCIVFTLCSITKFQMMFDKRLAVAFMSNENISNAGF